MARSTDHSTGAVRAKLEFPVWHRAFTKSYTAWANAPSDLKTPLLLQGQALAKAETWLLAFPDKLSESQKRFIVRSIAQRAKGALEPSASPSRKAASRRWQWRRPGDRSLWSLYAVIGLGLWFFSPDIIRDMMEKALNPADVYQEMKAAQAGKPLTKGDGRARSEEQTATEETAQPPEKVAANDGTAPIGDIDESPALYMPPKPPASPAVRLANIAREKLDAGHQRVALLMAMEATEHALADPSATPGDSAAAMSILSRAMAIREKLGPLAQRSATTATSLFCQDASAVIALDAEEMMAAWPASTTRRSASQSMPLPSFDGAITDRECRRIALPNEDFNIEVRTIAGGRPTAILHGHEARILATAFSPDGTLLATASQDGTARIFDARTGRQRFLLSGHDWHVLATEFSPDGRQVLTAASDMTARIWDTATGRQLQLLRGHQGVVSSARFNADGSRVLTTSWDGYVRLWETTGGRVLVALQQPGGLVSAALTRDGRRIATSTADGTLQFWDAATGSLEHVSPGPGAGIRSMTFTPDGRWLVVLSWEGQLELYLPDTGKLATTLAQADQRVRNVQLGQGGRSLAGITEDGTRWTWPLIATPEQALATAKSVAPPCLSSDERATLGLEASAPKWCDAIKPRDAALP